MKFFREKDVAWMQAQAVGASLQVGGTIWCIVPQAWYDRTGDGWGPFAIRIMAPAQYCGMRPIFELSILRFRMRWMSRGETHPDHYRWEDAGLTFRMLKKRKRAELKKVG